MSPRTPLLRPGRYFAEREFRFGPSLGVVVLLTGALVAAVFGIGWVFADRVDGTVTVDNPERPSDAFCENDFFNESGCDQPREVERDVDAIISTAIGNVAGQMLWVMPLAWLLVGVLLHAGSWLAGGEGGAARSFAVAAWGMAPTLLAIAVGLAVLAATFDPVTVTPTTSPAAFGDRLLGQLASLRLAGVVLGVVTTCWSGVVWTFGLKHWRGLSGPAAAAVAGVVAILVLLFGLA